MPVKKIVITGGPCAGKSTAMDHINKHFSAMGFRVISVPEGAETLMLGGMTYESCGSVDAFERNLLAYQMEQERKAQAEAELYPDDNVLIVCDRGTVDCRSYMTEEGYERAVRELGTTNVQLRDSYDAVFHMVTAARGAEECYVPGENGIRRETPEQAAAADEKLLRCWIGHPHLRIIGCTRLISGKLDELAGEIGFFLGVPQPVEIERKFLIGYPDIELLNKDPFCHRVEISQTYLDDGARIRKRGEDGDHIYFITHKKKISDITRIEIEERITKEEYQDLLDKAAKPLRSVSKDRYCIVYGNKYFELDVFPFWNDRAFLEIELKSEDEEYELPPYVKVIREVSSEKEYTNRSIAERLAAGKL